MSSMIPLVGYLVVSTSEYPLMAMAGWLLGLVAGFLLCVWLEDRVHR